MNQTSKQIIVNLITSESQLTEFLSNLIDEVLLKRENPSSNSDNDELLTIQQLADYFQVSTTTIHNWKNEGILPYVKVKSRIRFRKSVILVFDKKRRSKSKY